MSDLSPATRYTDYDLYLARFNETNDDTNLREAFRLLDIDQDGYVSKEELLAYYKFRGNEDEAKYLSAALFRMGDTNRDGYLEEDEFLRVASHALCMQLRPDLLSSREDSPQDREFQRLLNLYLETHKPQYIEAVFRLIDTNHDGVISKAELKASFLVRGMPDASLAADMMLSMGDVNEDGVLSMEEFKTLLGGGRRQ